MINLGIISLLFLFTGNIEAADQVKTVKYYYRTNAMPTKEILTPQAAITIDYNSPVFVLVHGWVESADIDYFTYIPESYFKLFPSCTFILVDWSDYANDVFYFQPAFAVKPTGDKIGDFLISLQPSGLNLKELHVIGHSLGAHVSSNVARRITSLTGIIIKRLSGLDPAGPLFKMLPQLLNLNVVLKPTDADDVDVLHTSLIMGQIHQLGTVDFYANPLFLPLQPGCQVFELCSHRRSHVLFNEAINSCGFLAKNKLTSQTAIYGEHMRLGTKGIFTFNTNSKSPYALGDPKCVTV